MSSSIFVTSQCTTPCIANIITESQAHIKISASVLWFIALWCLEVTCTFCFEDSGDLSKVKVAKVVKKSITAKELRLPEMSFREQTNPAHFHEHTKLSPQCSHLSPVQDFLFSVWRLDISYRHHTLITVWTLHMDVDKRNWWTANSPQWKRKKEAVGVIMVKRGKQILLFSHFRMSGWGYSSAGCPG